ncbi:hypothetical protein JMJ56_28615 [Belnapia sp. T18]|uniref:Uncharacterized protein n=1 Tax=Belnapia arida TaxID=2804533 RepID=A0ABS1UB75_9PROT|nr:hypothetical protein [Belnapia arida]MBL6081948.1 hypothetical protein [Belnapia arida]
MAWSAAPLPGHCTDRILEALGLNSVASVQQQKLQEGHIEGNAVGAVEAGDGVMVGMQLRRPVKHLKVMVRRPFDAARREDAVGVGVDQRHWQQAQVMLRLLPVIGCTTTPRAASGPPPPRKASRHPRELILHGKRQQKGLIAAEWNDLRHSGQIADLRPGGHPTDC